MTGSQSSAEDELYTKYLVIELGLMTDKYAVFGNPIAHSRSPDIHRQFAMQTGQDISYSKQLVAEDGFEAAANEFFTSGGKGLNITVPFKQGAYAYVARTTPRARRAGAVNTLSPTSRRNHFGRHYRRRRLSERYN